MIRMVYLLLFLFFIFPLKAFALDKPENNREKCFANILLLEDRLKNFQLEYPGTIPELSDLETEKLDGKRMRCPSGSSYKPEKSFVICGVHGNPRAEKKCWKNIREIMMAIELYNMEYPDRVWTINELIKENFLKNPPTCPLNGKYTAKNMAKGGVFYCSLHQDPNKPACWINIKRIAKALKLYHLEFRRKAPGLADLEKEGFISDGPRCLSAGKYFGDRLMEIDGRIRFGPVRCSIHKRPAVGY
ncbi:hypothetical protein ACFL35_02530 [Candidatus Riflebacteria bacterium]